MTSRQAGKRITSIAAGQKRRGRRQQGGARQPASRRKESLRPQERRRLIQLVACSGIFVLLVAVKLMLPAKVAQFNERLSDALAQNMDVQEVFSAVGRAISGEKDASAAAEDVYQAVFHPGQTGSEAGEALETGAIVKMESHGAMEQLQAYRKGVGEETTAEDDAREAEPAAEEAEVSTLAYVLYSDQNLPEDVSLEQRILGFDYCTPISGTISSNFGYREHPVEGEERFHYGVDLAADTGTSVACFADGKVKAVGESSSYGKYCIVQHEGGYSTLYAHCSKITASSGTAVKEGDKIAEVGETGIATGPHLHFELQKDGMYLNPIYYVTAV